MNTLPELVAYNVKWVVVAPKVRALRRAIGKPVVYRPLLGGPPMHGTLIMCGETGRDLTVRWDRGGVNRIPFPLRLEVVK